MNLKKILVPVTLSAGSRAAVGVAANLAQESGASIVLLHAVQLKIAGEERGIPRTRLLNELRDDVEDRLWQLIEGARVRVPTELVVCEGPPGETILEKANSLAADVIVMCTHGYRGWLRWLHRNTARYVLRHAPCPVWLVSPGKRNGATTLTIVDNTAADRSLQPPSRHEYSHPLQSVL
jgi:nucleotide-binding universal stress UspA family protein